MMADVHPWSKLAVKGSQIRPGDCNRCSSRIGESFVERLIEVIAHFAFELDLFIELETSPCADSGEIGAGLIEPQIIREHADVNVLVLLSLRRRHDPPRH